MTGKKIPKVKVSFEKSSFVQPAPPEWYEKRSSRGYVLVGRCFGNSPKMRKQSPARNK